MTSIPISPELQRLIQGYNTKATATAQGALFSERRQTPPDLNNASAAVSRARIAPIAKPSTRGGRFRRAPYQRSPDRERSKLRRQMLAQTSPLPPRLAAPLTPSQVAYARLLVDETLRAGDCRLSLDELGARTGTCCKTIQRAQYRLEELGLVKVELRPNEGQKHDTNVVTIVSTEWLTWIAMGKIPKRIGGQRCLATANSLVLKKIIDDLQRRRDAVDRPVEVDPGLKAVLDRWEGLIRTGA